MQTLLVFPLFFMEGHLRELESFYRLTLVFTQPRNAEKQLTVQVYGILKSFVTFA